MTKKLLDASNEASSRVDFTDSHLPVTHVSRGSDAKARRILFQEQNFKAYSDIRNFLTAGEQISTETDGRDAHTIADIMTQLSKDYEWKTPTQTCLTLLQDTKLNNVHSWISDTIALHGPKLQPVLKVYGEVGRRKAPRDLEYIASEFRKCLASSTKEHDIPTAADSPNTDEVPTEDVFRSTFLSELTNHLESIQGVIGMYSRAEIPDSTLESNIGLAPRAFQEFFKLVSLNYHEKEWAKTTLKWIRPRVDPLRVQIESGIWDTKLCQRTEAFAKLLVGGEEALNEIYSGDWEAHFPDPAKRVETLEKAVTRYAEQ